MVECTLDKRKVGGSNPLKPRIRLSPAHMKNIFVKFTLKNQKNYLIRLKTIFFFKNRRRFTERKYLLLLQKHPLNTMKETKKIPDDLPNLVYNHVYELCATLYLRSLCESNTMTNNTWNRLLKMYIIQFKINIPKTLVYNELNTYRVSFFAAISKNSPRLEELLVGVNEQGLKKRFWDIRDLSHQIKQEKKENFSKFLQYWKIKYKTDESIYKIVFKKVKRARKKQKVFRKTLNKESTRLETRLYKQTSLLAMRKYIQPNRIISHNDRLELKFLELEIRSLVTRYDIQSIALDEIKYKKFFAVQIIAQMNLSYSMFENGALFEFRRHQLVSSNASF